MIILFCLMSKSTESGMLAVNEEYFEMCDYSLHDIESRPARVGDKLITHDFPMGMRGFAAFEDRTIAVCLLPGTELAFDREVTCLPSNEAAWQEITINCKTAIFRQVNKEKLNTHHDALEFPDGQVVLLTVLCKNQEATVLQLPVRPQLARKMHRLGANIA
jgi:hypothetical protein